ncbi:zinc finger CCCH-type antiviral protein 1-like [Ruditapes philippinarum]|uniref:zinc finger CCCH-type antiviral protein 1-like n=1 Tax=Ruditapes philippinarum TaxID=129788 RepID=UPI00295BD75F|nr:zinc finger CCCH-type antiviral protein 1-like [Ruditapes philippinarum]
MSGKSSKGERIAIEVERLSTPSSINHENQTWRTNWLWYWKNPKGVWIKFGDLDDYEGNRAEIKSKELEKAFVSDPTGEANFRTTGTQPFDYIVEFRKMIQRNVTCKTSRKLCRRPEFINKLDFELNHLRLVKHADNTEIKRIKAPANWSIPKWTDLSEHILIVKESIMHAASTF